MAFFELRTPRDMLEKARREYGRLTTNFNIDNVFNFFVTVHHIEDYIEKTGAGTWPAFDAFKGDQDILDARDMCDKGKHLRLTHKNRTDPSTAHITLGQLNTVPLNTLPLNDYTDEWMLQSGNRTLNVAALAKRVVQKWEAFFLLPMGYDADAWSAPSPVI